MAQPGSTSNNMSVQDRNAENDTFVYDIDPKFSHDKEAPIWDSYNEHAHDWDQRQLSWLDNTLGTFLLFGTLFAAVVAPFVVTSYSLLQPDNQATTPTAMSDNSNLPAHLSFRVPGTISADDMSSSSPSALSIVASILWLLSLLLALLSTVFAVSIKQWLTTYEDDLSPDPLSHARQRHRRYLELQGWKVSVIVGTLPLLISLAAFLFLFGLVLYIWNASDRLGVSLCVLLLSSCVWYVFTTPFPIYEPRFPYRSLISRGLYFWTHGKDQPNNRRQPIMPETKDQDLQALIWLCTTASKQDVKEGSLFALVGWNPLATDGANMQTFVHDRAVRLINQKLVVARKTDNSHTALLSELADLAALSALLDPKDGYPMKHRTQYRLRMVAEGSDEAALPGSSLLACAFLLYAAGSQASVNNIAAHPHDRACATIANFVSVRLSEILEMQPPKRPKVSLLGSCLVMDYFRRFDKHLPKDALSGFLLHATDLPWEWLACYLAALTDNGICPDNNSVDGSPLQYFSWEGANINRLFDLFRRFGEQDNKWKNLSATTLASLMIYVRNNTVSLDTRQGELINLLTRYLPKNPTTVEPSAAMTSMCKTVVQLPVTPYLVLCPPQTISNYAMEAITALMGQCNDLQRMTASASLGFLMCAEPRNPSMIVAINCLRSRMAMKTSTLVQFQKEVAMTTLDSLVKQLARDDPRWVITVWLAREYVTRHPHAWDAALRESNWLERMDGQGLSAIQQPQHGNNPEDITLLRQILDNMTGREWANEQEHITELRARVAA